MANDEAHANGTVNSQHRFSSGEEIVGLDDAEPDDCLLLSGWVGLSRWSNDDAKLFGLLLPGDSISTVAGQGRCLAVALTAVTTTPSCNGQQQAVRRLAGHCFRLAHLDAFARIADFLLDTCLRLRDAGVGEGWTLQLPITQYQMAELLGLSPVHTNRTLRQLTDQSLIRISGRSITIQAPEKVAQLAQRQAAFA